MAVAGSWVLAGTGPIQTGQLSPSTPLWVQTGCCGVSGTAGRDGPSMASGLGSSPLVNQRLTDSQTGFTQALGAGWEPVLVWKLSGWANAAVTQTQHHVRLCLLAQRLPTDGPALAWAGDSAVTRMETFNLHLKQMWLPRGGG